MHPLIYIRESCNDPYIRIFYLDLILSKYGICDILYGWFDASVKINITASDLHAQITSSKWLIKSNGCNCLPRSIVDTIKEYIKKIYYSQDKWDLVNYQLCDQRLDKLASMIDEWIY